MVCQVVYVFARLKNVAAEISTRARSALLVTLSRSHTDCNTILCVLSFLTFNRRRYGQGNFRNHEERESTAIVAHGTCHASFLFHLSSCCCGSLRYKTRIDLVTCGGVILTLLGVFWRASDNVDSCAIRGLHVEAGTAAMAAATTYLIVA